MKKTVLFLSPFDFVEKGIQVIKLTPQHYSNNEWDVKFIVSRDSSKFGSYYYEQIQDPHGIAIKRVNMVSCDWILQNTQNKILRTGLTKLRQYFSIIQLFYFGFLEILKNKNIQLIYGYGPVGTISAFLLSKVFFNRSIKVISRFFGITDTDLLISQLKKRILNWEVLFALSLPVDACIITNDGTEGDKLLNHFFPKRVSNLHFWSNGVEPKKFITPEQKSILKKNLNLTDEIVIISISRLISWKRIDRSIDAFHQLVNNHPNLKFKFLIIGGGPEEHRLKKHILDLNLESHIQLTGPLKNSDLPLYYNLADIFISTYDLSNVGNPLLEAIRYNKIIITLNNGDTKSWIKNKVNGFIFDIENDLSSKISECIYEISKNEELRKNIIDNIQMTEKERIQTWEERLNHELHMVNNLWLRKI